MHDAHNQWPAFIKTVEKLAGATFNQTTLAIDAALAGQGIALVCRAFVEKDILAGRLIPVFEKTQIVKPDFFLVRKQSRSPQLAADAVWKWLQQEFTLSEVKE